jgi:hypothetical protein
MKTLRTLLLGVALLTVCSAANATINKDEATMSKNYAINSYVDAMTHGKSAGMNEVLDPTVKFSLLRGKQVMSFSKKEMLDYLKATKDVEQACTTNTQVIENDADQSVVKVDMQFDGFVRTNYVTLANTGNGWKITNVYSVFK